MRSMRTFDESAVIKLPVTIILMLSGLFNLFGQTHTPTGTITGNLNPELNVAEDYDFTATGWTPVSGSGVVNAAGNECNITRSNGDLTFDLEVQWTITGGTISSCNASTANVTWDTGGSGSLTYFQSDDISDPEADHHFWIGSLDVFPGCDYLGIDPFSTDIESGVIDIYYDQAFTLVPIDENGCTTGSPISPMSSAARAIYDPADDPAGYLSGEDREFYLNCFGSGLSALKANSSLRTTSNNYSYNLSPGTYGIEWQCGEDTVFAVINVIACTPGSDPVATFSGSGGGNCEGDEVTFRADINNWGDYDFEWTVVENGVSTVKEQGRGKGELKEPRSLHDKTITLKVTQRASDPCSGSTLSNTSNAIPFAAGGEKVTLDNSLTIDDLTTLPAGCAGSTVTIEAKESHTGVTYHWGGPGLVTPMGKEAIVTRGMQVTLEVTSTNECFTGSGLAPYNIPEGTSYSTLSNELTISDLTTLPSGCAGSTVTIEAKESRSGVTYHWGGEGFVNKVDALGKSVTVTRGMEVTLRVTSTEACVNNSSEASYNIPEGTSYTTLTNSLTVTDLNTLPGGCAGSTVTITASEQSNDANFVWGGPGFVSSTGRSAVVTRGMSVTLNVTPSASASCLNESGTTTYNIPEGTLYTTLSNSLTVSDLSTLPSGCAGSTVTITAMESHSGANYNWGGTGLVTPMGNSAVVTRGMPVTLEVTSVDACVNGSGVATYNIPEGITILTTSVSISTNASETVCKGTTVRFTANHENFTDPGFLWSTGATTSFIDKEINAAETITVTVTERDASACVSEPVITEQQSISVHDPAPVTASEYHYCSEDIDNNPVNGVTSMIISGIQPGFTYYIEAPTRIDASATGEFTGVFPAANYDVYAFAEGCTPEVVGSISVTKTDPPAELIVVENGTATDACFNSAELHADENGTDYQWYRDDEMLEDETGNFYDLTANDIGTHTYKVTYQVVEGTCTFSQEAELEVVVVEPERPALSVEVVGGETRVCADETVRVEGNLFQITGGTYTWSKIVSGVETVIESNDVIIDGDQASVPDIDVVIEEDTEIKLVVSNIEGCVSRTELSYSLFMEVKEIVQRVNQILTYCKYTSGLDLVLNGDDLDTDYALHVESPPGSGNYSFVSISEPRTVESQELRFGMQGEGNYQLTGSNTDCGIEETVVLSFTIKESPTPCLNFTTTQLHDESGIYGESREFFDLTGDAIQTNVRNLTEEYSLVDQVKYDFLDRPGLQTLPAPVVDADLDFFPDFVKTHSVYPEPRTFTYDKWDKVNPDKVSVDIENPLGRYYSELNDDDTDISEHPYSRTFYYNDGTGEIRSTSAAGDPFIDNADRRSYSKGFPVNYELDEDYLPIRELLFNYTDAPSLAAEIVKTVSRDANGLETVTFSDNRGNVLVTALGNLSDANAVLWETSFAEDQSNFEVLDFHVPQDQTALTVTLSEDGGEIIDLKDDAKVLDFTSVKKGFYRLTKGTLSYTLKYYNPSFNFYDDQGRLVLSIPPNGVKAIIDGFDYTSDVKNIPFATYYKYDFQGRLISVKEPDHKIIDDPETEIMDESQISNETIYVYRKDGSIKFSQNALQRLQQPKTFSYTNYDPLGRPIESGEYVGVINESYPDGLDFSDHDQVALLNPYLENTSPNGGFLDSWPHDRNDWVKTNYDLPDVGTGSNYAVPRNLELHEYDPRRSDLQVIGTLALKDGFSIKATDGTFYAKAISEQDLPAIDLPFVQDFVYGAVSYTENENVKTWYNYDEQGRVTEMSTWFKETDDAKSIRYEYDLVGNVTYVAYQEDYTKSDGTPVDNDDSFFHRYVYDKDNRLSKVYAGPVAISAETPDPLDLQATYNYYIHGPLKRVELAGDLQGIDYIYNLNGQLKAINDPNNTADQEGFEADAFAQIYEYYDNDYLRPGAFSGSNPDHDNFSGNIASVNWRLTKNGTAQTGKYQYDYDDRYFLKDAVFNQGEPFKVGNLTYDPNGNIQTLLRKSHAGEVQPGFGEQAGQYTYNDGTNQLQSVAGYASYQYDAIGQMIRQERLDGSGDIMKPVYNVTGKVEKILDGDDNLKITYEYDDRGFRIRSIDHGSSNPETYYVRDASGQLLAVYEKQGDAYVVKEHPIYGASRLGNRFAVSGVTQYELKDHLGNVRALINRQNRDADYVASYYPFGSLLRSLGDDPGRFGYQGDFAEFDEETGLNYFRRRMYDSKIGRWLTVDPVRQFASPYLAFGNNPTSRLDPDGGYSPPPGVFVIQWGGRLVTQLDPRYQFALSSSADFGIAFNLDGKFTIFSTLNGGVGLGGGYAYGITASYFSAPEPQDLSGLGVSVGVLFSPLDFAAEANFAVSDFVPIDNKHPLGVDGYGGITLPIPKVVADRMGLPEYIMADEAMAGYAEVGVTFMSPQLDLKSLTIGQFQDFLNEYATFGNHEYSFRETTAIMQMINSLQKNAGEIAGSLGAN